MIRVIYSFLFRKVLFYFSDSQLPTVLRHNPLNATNVTAPALTLSTEVIGHHFPNGTNVTALTESTEIPDSYNRSSNLNRGLIIMRFVFCHILCSFPMPNL